MQHKVAIIGSGNWGSVIAKIIGLNLLKSKTMHQSVRMWVHQEQVNGELLTDIINRTHINSKYLPGVQLSSNIVADPDLKSTVQDATLLVFVRFH